MSTYITETHEKNIDGRVISVVNMTPNFRDDQKCDINKTIRQQLFEIFCKYVSSKT